MRSKRHLPAGDAASKILAITLILWSLVVFLRAYTSINLPLVDDAYITYRYAQNFGDGQGLVYNPGELLLGTTTPGYALLLGISGSIFGSNYIPAISQLLNALGVLITAGNGLLLAYAVTRNLLIGSGVAALVLVNYNMLFAGISGMEATIFLGLVSSGLTLMVYQRWHWSALLFGLIPWFRPEGLFVIALFGLHVLFQSWPMRRKLGVIALALIPGIILAIGLTIYYGSPIPQSIIAKRAGLYPHSLRYTVEWMSEYVNQAFEPLVPTDRIARVRSERVFPLSLVFSTTFLTGTTILALYWIIKHARMLWMLPILNLILLLFFATSRTNIFEHYYALIEPLLLICWWIALYVVIRYMLHFMRISSAVAIFLAFGIVFIPQAQKLYSRDLSSQGLLNEPTVMRMIAYDDLAHALLPHLPPDTTIAMPEIGVLGYVLDELQIMDTGGLVTTEAVDYFPVPLSQRRDNDFGVIPPQMMKDMPPDMIVTLTVFIQHGLLDDPWLWENYALDIKLCNPQLPWESCLYVFTRHDLTDTIDLDTVARQFAIYKF